jgi:hypothetical protein
MNIISANSPLCLLFNASVEQALLSAALDPSLDPDFDLDPGLAARPNRFPPLVLTLISCSTFPIARMIQVFARVGRTLSSVAFHLDVDSDFGLHSCPFQLTSLNFPAVFCTRKTRTAQTKWPAPLFSLYIFRISNRRGQMGHPAAQRNPAPNQ